MDSDSTSKPLLQGGSFNDMQSCMLLPLGLKSWQFKYFGLMIDFKMNWFLEEYSISLLYYSYLRTSKAMMKIFHLTILLLSLMGLCQVAEGCCGGGEICTGSCFNGCSGACIPGTNVGGCPGGCPKGQFCVWKTCHPTGVMSRKVVSIQEALGEEFELRPFEIPENVEMVTFPTKYLSTGR